MIICMYLATLTIFSGSKDKTEKEGRREYGTEERKEKEELRKLDNSRRRRKNGRTKKGN